MVEVLQGEGGEWGICEVVEEGCDEVACGVLKGHEEVEGVGECRRDGRGAGCVCEGGGRVVGAVYWRPRHIMTTSSIVTVPLA